MFSILVNKKSGHLCIVLSKSKKYRKLVKTTHKHYKTAILKSSLEKEVKETNLLLLN